MNENQFERYTTGLTALAEANRQAAQEAAQRLEITKKVEKLIKQTAWCDGRRRQLPARGYKTLILPLDGLVMRPLLK